MFPLFPSYLKVENNCESLNRIPDVSFFLFIMKSKNELLYLINVL